MSSPARRLPEDAVGGRRTPSIGGVHRLERLINLVAALLHAERPLTAEELRNRLPGYAEDHGTFRRAFERDHYDVVAERFDAAVAAGAQVVSSREIVTRLHAAGLRRRKVSRLAG